MRMTIPAFLLAAFVAGGAQAASSVVAAVNMPAWLDHEGRHLPLYIGT
ncbi:MAG: hypothetical protein JO218_15880, partial [Burkholderiales bacterium]|nr:hypothetical protein [Burkholderiales bacterium]